MVLGGIAGMFIPLSICELHDLDWWVNWNNYWGGVLFCMSGVWGWFYGKIPLTQWQVGSLQPSEGSAFAKRLPCVGLGIQASNTAAHSGDS